MKCLERDANKRPSIRELFKEPWIAKYLNKIAERDMDDEKKEFSMSIKKNLIHYRNLN